MLEFVWAFCVGICVFCQTYRNEKYSIYPEGDPFGTYIREMDKT